MKTQEKTEKIQRKSFATTGTAKSTKTTYTAFFTWTQHLSRSITNWVWNFSTECQTTKQQRIYSQKKLKDFDFVGNLNKRTSEKVYMSFLVFGSTTYLKGNCFVKIVLSKFGLSIDFGFISAPNHVCTKLIKWNIFWIAPPYYWRSSSEDKKDRVTTLR